MENPSPSPESASHLADRIVQITRNITAQELDYSPKSLQQVEDIILGFRNEGQTLQTMEETVFLFGCYLGEVIIRNHGGAWKRAEETNFKKLAEPDTLVVEMPSKAVWNPIGKAFKLFENGDEDSLTFFYAAVASGKLG